MKRIIILPAAAIAAVAITGCGGSADKPGDPARAKESTAKVAPAKLDLAAIERQIKPSLGMQLTTKLGVPVKVGSLDCIEKDPTTAKCFARISGGGETAVAAITADVDQSTGKAIWRVDGA